MVPQVSTCLPELLNNHPELVIIFLQQIRGPQQQLLNSFYWTYHSYCSRARDIAPASASTTTSKNVNNCTTAAHQGLSVLHPQLRWSLYSHLLGRSNCSISNIPITYYYDDCNFIMHMEHFLELTVRWYMKDLLFLKLSCRLSCRVAVISILKWGKEALEVWLA